MSRVAGIATGATMIHDAAQMAPELLLIGAIFKQALADLRARRSHWRENAAVLRDDAVQFFATEQGMFDWYCTLAGLEPMAVRETVMARYPQHFATR